MADKDKISRKVEAGEKVGKTTRQAKSSESKKALGKKVVRKGTLKLPSFPASTGERPAAMVKEEARRKKIMQLEFQRRQNLLKKATPEERILLEHEWSLDDALIYHPDKHDKEIEVYPVKEPYAYTQIIRNEQTHELIYHIIEPMLSYSEKLVLNFIQETLTDIIDLQPGELNNKELKDYITEKFDNTVRDYSIKLGDKAVGIDPKEGRERLLYYIYRNFIGEGPLDPCMHDPYIEDISCDGPHVPVFVYHRKYEACTTTLRYRDHEELDSFVIRMAQRAGKHVSIAEPVLDAALKDGSRVNATLSKEISTFGSTYTIRKFKEVPFTPIELVKYGTLNAYMAAFMWMIIEHHQSFIYAGGTASGKTTSINALMMFLPPACKVVSIEDTREIKIPRPNWIAGLTRDGFGSPDANGNLAGEIDMFQLLKNALRQRPEYIVVGEVRGREAFSLFQAMATGHAAYGTMHADSVDAVIHRLESDPINIPRQMLEALDVVCVQNQASFQGKRVRRTRQIQEVVGIDQHTKEVLTNQVFEWDPATDEFEFSGMSYSLERIAMESGSDSQNVLNELRNRARVIQFLSDNDITQYQRVAQSIAMYYQQPKYVLQKLKRGEAWA